MKTISLLPVLLGAALLLPGPAAAGITDTVEPVRLYTDWEPTDVVAGEHRTLLFGDFAWAGEHVPSAVFVSPLSGAPQGFVDTEYQSLSQVAPDAGDGWYVVGDRKQLRRLRADGSMDPGFTVDADDDIRAFTLSPDRQTLWLVGRFATINGQTRHGMAAVRAADGALLPWTSQDWSGEGFHVATSADGSVVYAAGWAYEADQWRTLAAFDARTGAVLGYGPQGTASALAVGPDAVYVGVSGEDGGVTSVAALDPRTLAPRWQVPTSGAPDALGLARGRLFLTGPTTVAGVQRDGSAALDAATGALTEWTAGIPLDGVLLSPDGETLYSTYVPYDEPAVQLALSTRDGAELAWAPDSRGGSTAISRDGTRMLIGTHAINTRIRFGSAAIDETARIVPWASAPEVAYQNVQSAVVADGGAAFVAHGNAVSGLSFDGELGWQLATNGTAAVTLSADQETLYVTGSFTQLGGVMRPGFAAVRAVDGVILPWAPVAAGGSIGGAVPTRDGRTLYVYGSFTSIDGVPRRGVAALDIATGTVKAFDARLDGGVRQAKLSPNDGVLYVAGAFTSVGGSAHKELAGVATADGRLVWRPAVDTWVRDFEPLADGRTVVVAASVGRSPLPTWPLTAWDVRTGVLLDWNPVGDRCPYDCDVNALALDSRYLHVVGEFGVGEEFRTYARIPLDDPQPTPANTIAPYVAGSGEFETYAECDPGYWTGRPDRYRYAWRVNGVLEEGFEGREFFLTQYDLGKQVTCEVSAGGAWVRSEPLTVTAGERISPPSRRRPLPPDGEPPTPTPTPTPTVTVTPTATASPGPSVTPTPEPTTVPLQRDTLDPRAPAPRTTPPTASPLTDVTAPGAVLTRGTAARPAKLALSEPAKVTTTLKRGKTTVRRTFTLGAGRHTLTAKRLSGRAKLPRGRYTLTVRVRDAAGNAGPARVLRFTV